MVYLYDACVQISNFCQQQLLRKMWRKISWTDGRTDGQTDRGKTVYPPPPSESGGIKMWHWIYVLKVVINIKKKPEQISSDSFNYLLNLGRVTSEGSRNNVSINRNLLLPEVSPLLPVSSLKEKSFLPLIWK